MTGQAPGSGFAVEARGDGCAFGVKAHAGARRDGLGGIHDGMLKVEVTAAPEKGKANKAIARLLARALAVPPGAVTLLSGDTNTKKRFGITGLRPEEAAARIAQALG